MGEEVERLERTLDELAARLASDFDAPDELLAVLLAEIETTKGELRRALLPAERSTRESA